ncbi:hypothetical protein F4804DRAFT_348715 [Jackrogersella minutella]|nr:hypothetical protein F4804DRAFT_348715 [Jackrogersella minutella]
MSPRSSSGSSSGGQEEQVASPATRPDIDRRAVSEPPQGSPPVLPITMADFMPRQRGSYRGRVQELTTSANNRRRGGWAPRGAGPAPRSRGSQGRGRARGRGSGRGSGLSATAASFTPSGMGVNDAQGSGNRTTNPWVGQTTEQFANLGLSDGRPQQSGQSGQSSQPEINGGETLSAARYVSPNQPGTIWSRRLPQQGTSAEGSGDQTGQRTVPSIMVVPAARQQESQAEIRERVRQYREQLERAQNYNSSDDDEFIPNIVNPRRRPSQGE